MDHLCLDHVYVILLCLGRCLGMNSLNEQIDMLYDEVHSKVCDVVNSDDWDWVWLMVQEEVKSHIWNIVFDGIHEQTMDFLGERNEFRKLENG